ncbi:hypothetical protein JQX13_19080 [Archangium violaceum]|nr:hypothetical protein JQX13_19080 [Archangium violaceum]
MKTRLTLAGLFAAALALGTVGSQRAEARPQDLLQQQQEETTQENTDTTTEDQDTLDEPGTGGAGTGGTEGMTNEPGTGGTGDTGVLDEDEGVLQPGVNDEGLDSDQGQADQDTVEPGTRAQPEDQSASGR